MTTVTIAFVTVTSGPVYITGSGETKELAYEDAMRKFCKLGEEVDHSYVVDITE